MRSSLPATSDANYLCPICEALCGPRVTLDGDRVFGIRGNDDGLMTRGHVCPKGVAVIGCVLILLGVLVSEWEPGAGSRVPLAECEP